MKNRIHKLILDLIFPPVCAFCGQRLSPRRRHRVCDECLKALKYCRDFNRCTRCGKPIPDEAVGICKNCYSHRFYAFKITSAFVYADVARNGVLRFKREKNKSDAKIFASYVAGMVKFDFPAVEFEAVVSVPPRNTVGNRDMYDQAEKLATETALLLDLPYLKKAMRRNRRTKRQSSLNYIQRIQNVKDCFEVIKKETVKNKTILLIDDVGTTCASIEECAKALKEAGAYQVYAATIATVPALEMS